MNNDNLKASCRSYLGGLLHRGIVCEDEPWGEKVPYWFGHLHFSRKRALDEANRIGMFEAREFLSLLRHQSDREIDQFMKEHFPEEEGCDE